MVSSKKVHKSVLTYTWTPYNAPEVYLASVNITQMTIILLLSPGPPERSHATHISLHLWSPLLTGVVNGSHAASCETTGWFLIKPLRIQAKKNILKCRNGHESNIHGKSSRRWKQGMSPAVREKTKNVVKCLEYCIQQW